MSVFSTLQQTQVPPGEAAAISAVGKTIFAARIALVVGIGISVSDYCSQKLFILHPISRNLPCLQIVETIPREARFFWSGRVTAPRVLYFTVCRIVGVIGEKLELLQIRYSIFIVQILNFIGAMIIYHSPVPV
jgi:hypothetical protein